MVDKTNFDLTLSYQVSKVGFLPSQESLLADHVHPFIGCVVERLTSIRFDVIPEYRENDEDHQASENG